MKRLDLHTRPDRVIGLFVQESEPEKPFALPEMWLVSIFPKPLGGGRKVRQLKFKTFVAARNAFNREVAK
jgi:hypothetical protein